MNDIVITYDSKFNSEDKLRKILRVIETECTGFNEIFLVGDLPDWAQGIINIPHSGAEDEKSRMKNKFNKLKSACLNRRLTKQFFWIDADGIVPKFDATVAMRISLDEDSVFFKRCKGSSVITYEHTKKLMSRRGFIHKGNYYNEFPMSMNKEKFMNTFEDVDFNSAYGYCIKTIYSNYNRLQPTDFMIWMDLEKYNNKSTYEKN